MKAKTIFLTDKDETIIYEGNLHSDNHERFVNEHFKNLKIDDYIPILLAQHNYCIIELARKFNIGVVYLPIWLSNYQKQYFHNVEEDLKRYTIYLNNYSLEHPIDTKQLLLRIDNMPERKEDYN